MNSTQDDGQGASTAGGAGKAAAAPMSDYRPIADELSLIFIIALGIFGLFVLANIPRIAARLLSGKRAGQLFKGIWFGDRGKRNSPVRQYTAGLTPPSPRTPRHMPSWGELVPGSGFLNYQIPLTRGYTVGQMVTLVVYAALVGVAIGIKNPIKEATNVGQVAIFQIPVAALLGIPLTPATTLLGISYRQLNYLHRFVGRMIFATSSVHVGIYTYKFVDSGVFTETVKKQKFIGGYLAFGSVCFMVLTSLPVIRSRVHGLFRVCHLIGFAFLMIGLILHMPRTALMATIAVAIYAKDIFLRLFKLRIKKAYLTAMPQCSSTQITVPNITSGWRAGQYVYVRIPAVRKMGGISWLENHPFSIASADGGQLIVIARKRGDWTRALFDLAMEGTGSEKGDGSVECKVVLEGPYGGSGPVLITSYSGLILIAGGSGVTYALGVLEDTVHKSLEKSANTSSIAFVWIIKNQQELRPFAEHIKSLVKLAEEAGISANVSIYVTRSSSAGSEIADGMTIHHIKPFMRTVIETTIETCRSSYKGAGNMQGVYVGVCGPAGLVKDSAGAVTGMSWQNKKRVGGVELHKEFFAV